MPKHTLSRCEAELISLLRNSPNPGEAFLIAVKAIQKYLEEMND